MHMILFSGCICTSIYVMLIHNLLYFVVFRRVGHKKTQQRRGGIFSCKSFYYKNIKYIDR